MSDIGLADFFAISLIDISASCAVASVAPPRTSAAMPAEPAVASHRDNLVFVFIVVGRGFSADMEWAPGRRSTLSLFENPEAGKRKFLLFHAKGREFRLSMDREIFSGEPLDKRGASRICDA